MKKQHNVKEFCRRHDVWCFH